MPAHIRGIILHENISNYLLSNVPCLDVEVGRVYYTLIQELKNSEGNLHVEERWYFDPDWNPVEGRPDTGIVSILDACLITGDDTARVIDYKTGAGRFTYKHEIQGMIYAKSVFAKFPDVAEVLVEFWYLDQPINWRNMQVYHRDSLPRIPVHEFLQNKTKRPNGGSFTCKSCPHAGVTCLEYVL